MSVFATAQTTETVNGASLIHNKKGGVWGKNPKVTLKLVRTIGDVNTTDDNFAFNSPLDVVLDAPGNIYVLDAGNQRVQKFSPDGRYLATIGRKGQGPGEFMYPRSLDVDSLGRLYVLDNDQKRVEVFTTNGRFVEIIPTTKLSLFRMLRLASGTFVAAAPVRLGSPGEQKAQKAPMLLELLDPGMKMAKEFGDVHDYGDEMTNTMGNSFLFAHDQDDICLAFVFQNRVEKYSRDGGLIWRADRELNYTTKVLEKGKKEAEGSRMISYTSPKMNHVAAGIAADGKGRVWVAGLNRQIKREEEVIITIRGTASGGETRKVSGNTDRQTTDMFKLEMFDPDGILLGDIPVTQFVDGLYISGDRLFMLDRDRGVKIYEYKILEK